MSDRLWTDEPHDSASPRSHFSKFQSVFGMNLLPVGMLACCDCLLACSEMFYKVFCSAKQNASDLSPSSAILIDEPRTSVPQSSRRTLDSSCSGHGPVTCCCVATRISDEQPRQHLFGFGFLLFSNQKDFEPEKRIRVQINLVRRPWNRARFLAAGQAFP